MYNIYIRVPENTVTIEYNLDEAATGSAVFSLEEFLASLKEKKAEFSKISPPSIETNPD